MPRRKKTEDKKEIYDRLDEIYGHPRRRKKRKPKTKNKRLSFFLAAGINLAFLYLVNQFPSDIPFLDYLSLFKIFPILKLFLAANIFGNLMLLVDAEGRFGNFIRMVMNIFGIAFAFSLYIVFPFDFSFLPNASLVVLAVRIATLASILSFGVSGLIEVFQMVFEE